MTPDRVRATFGAGQPVDLQAEVLARLETILEKRSRSRRRRQDWQAISSYVASAEAWAERYEAMSSGSAAERAAALRAEVERVDRAERQGKSAAQILKMLGHEDRARDALVAYLRYPDDAEKKSNARLALHLFGGPVDIEAVVQIDREYRTSHANSNGGPVNRAKRIIRRLNARPYSWVGPEADF